MILKTESYNRRISQKETKHVQTVAQYVYSGQSRDLYLVCLKAFEVVRRVDMKSLCLAQMFLLVAEQ